MALVDAAYMQYPALMIVSYFKQLVELATKIDEEATDSTLLRAFAAAGVPSSTFYRARGGTDLHAETAEKVARVLTLWIGDNGRDERDLQAAAPAV